jgi:hypothetical protein
VEFQLLCKDHQTQLGDLGKIGKEQQRLYSYQIFQRNLLRKQQRSRQDQPGNNFSSGPPPSW